MPISHPYRRTCRQFVNGEYNFNAHQNYMEHQKFAKSPEHYVRAFLIIQKDLQELFDYVEPAFKNRNCYSYRIHGMLLRACIEVEANCKAILKENGYSKSGDWNMSDYKKIEETHLLSKYEIMVPNWTGKKGNRSPFSSWSKGKSLPWYGAYNTTKHDRHSEFKEATFDHLIDAYCGLLVLLSAQFGVYDFSTGPGLMLCNPTDGRQSGIGGFFRIKFPTSFPENMRYDFDWQTLKDENDPFQNIDYSTI